MSTGRNITDLTLLTGTPPDATLLYAGLPPFDLTDDRSVSYGTLKSSLSGAGSWTTITGPTTLSPNTNYFVNAAAPTALTLPSSFAAGDVIRVIGIGIGSWHFAQNTLQSIRVGSLVSTIGPLGTVTANNSFNQISLIGTAANTTLASFGAPVGSFDFT